MLSLLWTKLIDIYSKILDEKLYKTALLILVLLFLASSVMINNKVQNLTSEIKHLPTFINSHDSTLEIRLNTRINQLYTDNSELFEMYVYTYKDDLIQIIKHTANNNSELLQALIEKSTKETINEIRKQNFNNRYRVKIDSLKIIGIPEALNFDNQNSLFYAFNK